jgi:SOS-response transcriptional repressor LexA
MEDAGIFDVDIAIQNGQAEAANGEIAAVVINDSTTSTRILRTAQGIRLQAENPNYPDLIFDRSAGSAMRIAGVPVGISRVV